MRWIEQCRVELKLCSLFQRSGGKGKWIEIEEIVDGKEMIATSRDREDTVQTSNHESALIADGATSYGKKER